MALKDSLTADMKAVMKEGQKTKLSVLRLLQTAIQYEEIEKNRELNDEEILGVIAREIKQRQDAIPDYERANREEAVKRLREEIEYLQTYLPRQMTDDEIRDLALQVIEETGAQGPGDIGKVMKAIIPRTKGRADGRVVNNLVRQILESK
ncbi:MAG: GatB/YqeY domain-containing protein [Syntrophomonadaceae bacterium]|mgnify:CR=1 FL=1|nr:GatB/YqeY domain-containing protein [Syntrophomonadaceae bacterium]